jgi:hypothetical protein
MAAESILAYKRPGFPKTSNSEKSYLTTIEYVGPLATLSDAEPDTGAAWGDYAGIVTGTVLSPIEGTTQAELTVTCEDSYDGSGGGSGSAREISYEVEWVMFQRPLAEHPVFRTGGAHALDATDHADIAAWRDEPDPTLKGAYKYNELALTGSGSEAELSDAAIMFAKGIELGMESYEDYAPVIRKTTTYVGGLPGASTAGEVETGPTFTGKPSGYEWRKSADRAIRQGGQTRWERIEEWIGAEKVLIDRNTIYWE